MSELTKEQAKTGNWQVQILESESGWGGRIDSTHYFTNEQEAKAWAKAWAKAYNDKYNPKRRTEPTPEWYMIALEPTVIT